MYVNTEHFLSDTAAVTLKAGIEGAGISIVDERFRMHLFMSIPEARELTSKFDTLDYHTVFYIREVAVFSKSDNDSLAVLRAQLETL